MAKLSFKLKEGSGFQIPPEGVYDYQITEVSTDTDKEGSPQVVCQLTIVGTESDGMAFKQYYTLNEKRGWLLLKLLDVTGVEYTKVEAEEDGELPELTFDPDDLLYAFFQAELIVNRDEAKKKDYINLRNEQASTLSDEDASEGADEGDEPAAEAAPEPEPEPPAAEEKPKARRRRRPPAQA